MLLVVGGAYSGKRTYVRSLGYADPDMGLDPYGDEPVLLQVEEWLRDHEPTPDDLAAMVSKEVVVTSEVGAGVVPVDADERVWRERVGRFQATLAGQAREVVRLVCGIATHIKGGNG